MNINRRRPVALAAGPRTGRVASKAASIVNGVRAFFGVGTLWPHLGYKFVEP